MSVEPPSNDRHVKRRLGVLFFGLMVAIAAKAIIRPSASVSPPTQKVDKGTITTEAIDKGIEYASDRRWLEALQAFDVAIHSGSDTARARIAKAFCLGKLGRVEDAISEYETAIRLEPSEFNTYISLATAYRAIGLRSDALRTLRRAEDQLQKNVEKDAPARYARPEAPKLESLSEAYGRLGEFQKSIDWASKAQDTDPTRANAYLLEGKTHLVLRQPEKALPLLRRACALANDNADAHYTLALALRSLPSRDRNESAFQHLTRAVTLDSRFAPAVFQLGVLHAERRQWKEARRAFTVTHELQFEQAESLRRAGEAARKAGDEIDAEDLLSQYAAKIGDFPAALRYFRKFTSIPKYRLTGYVRTAIALQQMGKPKDAVAALRRAIALDPTSADLHRQLASVYNKTRQFNEQVAALQEASRLDLKNAHVDYSSLAKLYFEAGKYDEAEAYFEKCVQMQPDNGRYHYSLGETYLMRPEKGNRLSKAIASLKIAQRLTQHNSYTHDFLSVAYMKARRWADAADTLERAINLTPENELLYFRLGQAYQRLGKTEEASFVLNAYRRLRKYVMDKDLLKRRIKSHPKDVAAHAALGDLFLKSQQYPGARREFERVLELSPGNADAHEKLSIVYGELAKPEGQWEHLQKAQQLRARN